MNGNYGDDYNQNELDTQNSGVPNRADQFYNGVKTGFNGYNEIKNRNNKQDIDAINNRKGKNNPDDTRRSRKSILDGDDDTGSRRSLPKKDGLDSKDELGGKDSLKGKGAEAAKGKAAGAATKGAANEAAKKAAESQATKKAAEAAAGKSLAALKLKITLYVVLIGAGALLSIAIIASLIFAIDNFTTSISTFFGVAEQGTGDYHETPDEEENGLYTNDEYLFNEEGEMIGWYELIDVLKAGSGSCPAAGFWDGFWDSITGWFDGKEFKDVCDLLEYIRESIEDYEEIFDVELNKGLILGTIFYGYDQQATYMSYDDPTNAEFYSSAEHFEILETIVVENLITRDDIDRIIQNTIFEDNYPYFTWVIKDVFDEDGKLIKQVGYCNQTTINDYEYSLEKWEMLLRWNDELEPELNRNEFSLPGYIGIKRKGKLLDRNKGEVKPKQMLDMYGSGYVYDTALNNSWESTSVECNDTIDEETLIEMYKKDVPFELDSSVPTAHEFFDIREMTGIRDTEIYFQKIEDDQLFTTTKDTFEDRSFLYTKKNLETTTYSMDFEYKYGFAYYKFPGFKKAIDEGLEGFKFNEITTPKKIETIIQEVENRKYQLNEVLLFDDIQSHDNRFSGNFTNAPSGQYIDTNIAQTYCGNYLSAGVNNITVNITDCDGRALGSTSMKDYIIGVAYGEVGYQSSNDNYVITQMVAAMNFALQRRQNYTKGSQISMKSGNCDQVHCFPSTGCKSQTAALKCGSVGNCTSYVPATGSGSWKSAMTSAQYAKYGELYEIASKYLLIENGNITVSGGYQSDEQNEWKEAAKNGKSYLEILQETYPNAQIVNCSQGVKPSASEEGSVTGEGSCKNYLSSNDYDQGFNQLMISFAEKHANNNDVMGVCNQFVIKVLEEIKKQPGYEDVVILDKNVSNVNYMFKNFANERCVKASDVQPGDLVFYGDGNGTLTHIAIYAGSDGNNILVYDTNTGGSCELAKGSTCESRDSADAEFYKIPKLHSGSWGTIVGYARWYTGD